MVDQSQNDVVAIGPVEPQRRHIALGRCEEHDIAHATATLARLVRAVTEAS